MTLARAAFAALALALLALGLSPLGGGAAFAQDAPASTLTITPASDPTAEAETRPLRILLFGDSLTEGYGLAPKDGLVPQLQRWLVARDANVRIDNAGLTGDTSYGGRIRIKWALRHRPDAVVIEIGANDFLMGWALGDIEKNLDAIITQAKAGGRPVLLVGIAPPREIRGIDRSEVAAMWQKLAARHDVLLLPDLYAPVWAASEPAPYLQADGLHLSSEGVTQAIAQGLGDQVLALIARTRALEEDKAARNEKDRASP